MTDTEKMIDRLKELEDSKFLEHYGTINKVDMSAYQEALSFAISAIQENERLREACMVFARWADRSDVQKLEDGDSIVLPIRVEFLRKCKQATQALERKG